MREGKILKDGKVEDKATNKDQEEEKRWDNNRKNGEGKGQAPMRMVKKSSGGMKEITEWWSKR